MMSETRRTRAQLRTNMHAAQRVQKCQFDADFDLTPATLTIEMIEFNETNHNECKGECITRDL
jgi:hypothetical protein